MKNILFLLVVLFIIGFLFLRIKNTSDQKAAESQSVETIEKKDKATIKIVAENLDTPWGIVFLPDNSMLVTERPGSVRLVDSDSRLAEKPVAVLTKVKEISEGGLLGITIHPDFLSNGYVFLYYTYQGNDQETLNRVVRMTYKDGKLNEEKIIVDAIPGAPNHNGGRIKFGPDKFLYITTGDAQNPSKAQNKGSFAGKILQVKDEGKPVVYSYGHRNPQGLAWNSKGELWSTEHGRSGIQSGLDELNLIQPGKNYGWPTIQGTEKKDGLETPRLNSGSDTWAPAGAAFIGDSLFFGGLRGQALYEAVFSDGQIILKEHLKNEFGRIRDVVVGPDDNLYITTSNQDGRGRPNETDDKIIRVNPKEL